MDDRRAEIRDRLAVDAFLVVVVDEARDEDLAAAAFRAIEDESAVVEEAVGARRE